jgi:hypothetical protein
MIQKFATILLLVISSSVSYAQKSNKMYENAYCRIDSMLKNKSSLSFKEAVLFTENAYFEGNLNYQVIYNEFEAIKKLTEKVSENISIEYNGSDKLNILKSASLFKVITDTTYITTDSVHIYSLFPYTYDFDDMWGEKDWTKMFVSKLLTTKKGNCHSMPYLYKILAEELNIPAYLALAPNHIYVKTYSQKMGWYNTELTSGTFPIDAWIIASGYVTVDAVRNGLYMDTLNTKQCVANCLLDLAQGFQHKYGKTNPDFVVKCCNTCLKYHPTNVNAMLTKAEAQKYYIQAQMKAKNVKTPQELFADNLIKDMFADMEQVYVRLHQLGYKRMPEEMYMQWMGILKNEPSKYNNTKVSVSKKRSKNLVHHN